MATAAYTANIQHTFTAQQIADVMTGLIESPMGDWVRAVTPVTPRPDDIEESPWYAAKELYDRESFEVQLIVEGADDDSDKSVTVTRETITEALSLMGTKYPSHMRDLIRGNDDAITYDVFGQCLCYGEVVFG